MIDEGFRDSGEYALDWEGVADDGNPLASGVYFIVLRAHGGTATRKAVLAK